MTGHNTKDGADMRPKGPPPPVPDKAGAIDWAKLNGVKAWIDRVSELYPDIQWSVEIYRYSTTFVASHGPACIRRSIAQLELESAKFDLATAEAARMAYELRKWETY